MKRTLLLMVLVLSAMTWQRCEDEEDPGPVDCAQNPVGLQLVSTQDSNCGSSDGRIEVRATGGAGDYRYSINGGAEQAEAVFTGLAAGTYTLTAVDGNECSGELQVDVKNLDGLNISFDAEPSGCGTSNGTLTVNAFDGQPPYQFRLGDGAVTESNSFTGLGPGDYQLVVTDATGCEVQQSVKVTSGVSFATSISPIIQNKCAVSGCHNGSQAPDFRVFKNIHDNAGQIKTLTGNGTMPQNGTLTQTEINMIACWVDDGALDN